MHLGNFSISLAVEDIKASFDFYSKFGFEQIDGKIEEKWIILQNGKAVIGLFQGMFTHNIITFQPDDVRSIQKSLKSQDVKFEQEADETTTHAAHAEAPVYASLKDPDGNVILLDQVFSA